MSTLRIKRLPHVARPAAAVLSERARVGPRSHRRGAADAPLAIPAGSHAAVPTASRLRFPQAPRAKCARAPASRRATRHGAQRAGTVDADYRGEVQVLLVNHGAETFTVTRGMRIPSS